MKKIYFSLVLLCLSCLSLSLNAQTTTTFSYTGSPITYSVPSGTTLIQVDMNGGSGGKANYTYSREGNGARVQCTLNVTSIPVLYMYVGGGGGNGGTGTSGTAGFNGGAIGSYYPSNYGGGGGGGASDIRTCSCAPTTTNRLVVAGGGGGGAYNYSSTDYDRGGDGGGTTGENGFAAGGNSGTQGGGGGTPSGGGVGSTWSTPNGSPGTLGAGGAGSTASTDGGGGGGGYYGGGGGYWSGGGGGSSYTDPTLATNVTHTRGYNATANANGQIVITQLCNSPGTITGSNVVCFGGTTTLSNPTGASGGTWSSTATGVATINPTSGLVTAVSAGVTNITYTVGNPCGALATMSLTVSPAIAISGAPNVCTSNTRTLTPSPTGGTFTTTSSIISVGGSSGVVSGITAGATTITYTLPSGCQALIPFTVNGTPASITGTTTLCAGSTSTLSDVTSGGTWSSTNTTQATVGSTGIVTGVSAGSPIIIYTAPTGCTNSIGLTINGLSPLTGLFGVCNGSSTTLSDASAGGLWTSSNPAVATVGSTNGLVTSVSPGSTIITYLLSSGCSATATFGVSTTPSVFTVSGGGTLCSGATGVTISLSGSAIGVSYQLYDGVTPMGSPVVTTGSSGAGFSFPPQTTAGTYTVVANNGSSCATTMSGSAFVSVNVLPTQMNVTGGGAYCSGGTGSHIGLNSSQIGVTYNLLNSSSTVISTVAGTGGAIDFGLVTTVGTYTANGTNTVSGCVNTMNGSATVTTNPLPVNTYSVTGAGGFCAGGTGVPIGLSSSDAGINYQLFYSGSAVGSSVAGTGASIGFGTYTTGGAYTVVATNATTGCTSTMVSTATVTVNALPTVFTVTGGGAYCSGATTGVAVGLGGSTSGISYQLYNTGVISGSAVTGTGSAISFGGVFAGAYTVTATNTITGCAVNMASSVLVSVNPLPTSFTITGGGNYCAGGVGSHVGLSGSVIGTNYQLFIGTSIVGAASGSSGALDFGLQLTAGTYTVIATNSVTGCTNPMGGSVSIAINPLPTPFTVTGGGNYCAGGTGVAVGLSGSTSGITYQLYLGSSLSGSTVGGSGTAISFSTRSAAGSYTATALNTSTGCTIAMLGSVAVGINPLPTIYNVTGGGAYCIGGTGVHVGLSAADAGISYQLYNGSAVGTAVSGSGSPIDFGLETVTGTYTVVATNGGTTCTVAMGGNTVVSTTPLPVQYTVSAAGTGAYCAGATAPHVLLSSSNTGINYQLYNGTARVGAPFTGSGFPMDLGAQAAPGTYTVVAIDATTSCTNNMLGSAIISINPLPNIYNVTGGGNYCSATAPVHIGLNLSTTGISYQLYNGPALVGAPVVATSSAPLDMGAATGGGAYTVIATNPLTSCTVNMFGNAVVSVNPLPASFSVTGGGNYCFGGSGVHVGLTGSVLGTNYQLFRGTTSAVGAPLPGIGASLDFGLQTTAGTYSVVATIPATGCTATMGGVTSIAVSSLPVTHNVTGSGSYCPGGTGRHVFIDGSDIGISYQLYQGVTAVSGAVLGGTGTSLDFGSQLAGSYTVVGRSSLTTCSNNMTGIATITIAPLPAVYNVTGGGNYCPGRTGVHIGLSGSNTGVNYQLYNGTSGTGAAVAGTGLALDFGLLTTVGNYTVVATNLSTACQNNMSGTVTVSLNALPDSHSITGGGNFCSGGTGVDVALDGSTVGTNYQLLNGTAIVGAPMTGTGSGLDFGIQTAAGTYTILANNTITTCTGSMTGIATIVVNPLPDTFSVIGGGTYCIGGSGVHIGLRNSVSGINYQLYSGTTATGSAVAGSGSSIDFGAETTAGNYTVVATNAATSCMKNMPGSANVTIGSLPVAYTVTGGGNICAGGAGVHVSITGSNTGVTYQLYKSSSPVGSPVAGTGAVIDFGAQTASGAYTVMATDNTTGCVNNMTGGVSVGVNPLPVVHTVGSLGSTYCTGGPGVDITLNGSEVGVSYNLLHGTVVVGTQLGTGAPLDFGYMLPTGAYTVVAVNSSTGCTNNMAGTVAIAITPLPTVYTVTGGGNYCSGGTGTHIDLSGSATGISYQLMLAGVPVGTPVAGTGSSIDLGAQTATGAYSVVATNTFTTCSDNMSGSAIVGINALPSLYAVMGGGNYCAGGTGSLVSLGGSNTGISYQLFRGTVAVGAPVAGTGSVISFGLQTAAATYTIVGTNTTTGCTNSMIGSVVVGINPAPSIYTLTGGGNYCAGAAGVHIGLSGSHTGVSYQVYDGTTAVPGALTYGSGSSIDLGVYSTAGSYTVVATDGTTTCTSNMSGTAVVGINPLPAVFAVTGGGSYCAAGTGVHIGLNGSVSGTRYQLFNGFTPAGTVSGTGGILDLGLQTAAGTYTVVAISSSSCTSNMTGSATVVVNPNVTPIINFSDPSGDTVCSGDFITFTSVITNGGTAPTYQWMVNGVNAGTNATYGYIPANGDVVTAQLTSNAACASPATVSSVHSIHVNPKALPAVSILSAPGTEVCTGTAVTFTASPSYGGVAPTYNWIKNTANAGSGSSFTYTPSDGDNVYCVMTSDYACRLANNASSNHITMTVDVSMTPTVVITTIPGNTVAPGQLVTIEATVTNAGSSPTFQWLLNGIQIPGATSPVLTRTFSDMDVVTCDVTSSGGCAGVVGNGSVTIHVTNVGVTQVASASGSIQLVPNPNKGLFTVKGTLATTSDEEVTLEVTDMIGKVVYSSKVVARNGELNEKIQINNLANGMYILSVHSETESKVFHMVVEQ